MLNARRLLPERSHQLPEQEEGPSTSLGGPERAAAHVEVPGHDFGSISVQRPEPAAKGRRADSCPLRTSPSFCPYGGACHLCPA